MKFDKLGPRIFGQSGLPKEVNDLVGTRTGSHQELRTKLGSLGKGNTHTAFKVCYLGDPFPKQINRRK